MFCETYKGKKKLIFWDECSILTSGKSYDLKVKVNGVEGHSMREVIDKIELNGDCTFTQSLEMGKDKLFRESDFCFFNLFYSFPESVEILKNISELQGAFFNFSSLNLAKSQA